MSSSPHHDERPAKRRRPRAQLSCTECRRLKMKCNRVFPCLNCERRECADLCRRGGPTGNNPGRTSTTSERNDDGGLRDRLEYLESLLLNGGMTPGRPPQSPLQSSTSQLPPAELMSTQIPAREPSPTASLLSAHGIPALAAAADMVDERQVEPVASTSQLPDTRPVTAHLGADPEAGVHAVTGEAFEEEPESIGTLVMFPSGRAKFLGRSAATEWLKNQETLEAAESPPPVSRAPSPPHSGPPNPLNLRVAFPFNTVTRSLSTASLLAQLPPLSDGRTLVDVYMRHFFWHFNVVSEEKVTQIFSRAYGLEGEPRIRPDELALLYIILAMGAYYNLELPADDSTVEDYVQLSRCCLAKADFLSRNTIAGLQALFIMGHLQHAMESGRNGDTSWPLWGLVIRTAQAMGLHRDGKRWNLPEDVIEERRRIFWECYLNDLMMSNNFCRPGSISPEFMDTAFPTQHDSLDLWYQTKFKMAPMFIATLNHSMRVQTPPYSNVGLVNQQICDFERNIPFELRCRPVLLAIPSAYPDPDSAIRASPEVNKRKLQLTFQQFTLALNVSECLVHLHRPYFARALHDSPADPTRSRFGTSYLVVVERCHAIGVIASTLHNLYPQAAARHWWIWYHAFASAACMGTLVLKTPQNVLASFAVTLVDTVIRSYASAVKSRNSPLMVKNLQWLVAMRSRMETKMRLADTPEGVLGAQEETNEESDLELLGWRTRLIERAGQGQGLLRRTIAISPQSQSDTRSPLNLPIQASLGIDLTLGSTEVAVSDELFLDQFWDALAAQDGVPSITAGSVNWWPHGFDDVGGVAGDGL